MSIDLRRRSVDPEVMDDLSMNEPVVFQTLKELDFINWTLGGNQISIRAYKDLVEHQQEVTLMDVGCGSGALLRKMSRLSEKSGMKFRGLGVDANPHICEYAYKHTAEELNIRFDSKDVLDERCYDRGIDIIHACLFTHHFTTEQLIWLFKTWKKTAQKGVIINDLHRHPLAYYSIKGLTQAFSKSSMVKYDAPLSVARGFTKKELEYLLLQAGITNYKLQWKWAFRWLLVF